MTHETESQRRDAEHAQPTSPPPGPAPGWSALALLSLAVGVLVIGLPWIPWGSEETAWLVALGAPIVAALGLVGGIIALVRIVHGSPPRKGRTAAIVGIVLTALSVIDGAVLYGIILYGRDGANPDPMPLEEGTSWIIGDAYDTWEVMLVSAELVPAANGDGEVAVLHARVRPEQTSGELSDPYTFPDVQWLDGRDLVMNTGAAPDPAAVVGLIPCGEIAVPAGEWVHCYSSIGLQDGVVPDEVSLPDADGYSMYFTIDLG